ncbi:MAG: FkbM family methyltransferase [Planctomycetes bacterium]|nr:FkbM family methyltransferase [Planctomycetota bacterium]
MVKKSTCSLRRTTKNIINKLLGIMDLKIVNISQGPLGFFEALHKVKKQGVAPLQIIDAGAAVGAWTRKCLELFPDAEYFLVEPLDENSVCLNELQQTNPKVKVWQGALGSQPGQFELYSHGDQSSFFTSEYSQSNEASTRTVPVRTLDSFMEDSTIQQPDMIKADVQSFEIEVLRGAEKCLENTELLLLEVSYRRIYQNGPLAQEVISYVGSKGFRILDICTYIKRPFDGELTQSDILFAKDGSRLFEPEGWEPH